MFWPSIGAPWTSYPTITSRFGPGQRHGVGGAPPAPEAAQAPGAACVPGMVDLSELSGLPLWLDPQQESLVLAQPLLELRPEPQPTRLLSHVLLDPAAPLPEVYCWVYRDVALATDEGVFHERGVRHDLLLLHPGRLGREFVKTWGHVTSCAEEVQCPEVYGALHGRGLFLAQEPAEPPLGDGGPPSLRDVRWIEAVPGQKVIVPAGYGVVIANVGDAPLVLSRLVAADTWPVHRLFEEMGGAAYYVVERGGEPEAEPNPHYARPLPPVRKEEPLAAPDLGVEQDTPLYSAFVHHPERFAWLRQGLPAPATGP